MTKPKTITISMRELDRLKTIQAVVAGQSKASAAGRSTRSHQAPD